MHHIPRHLHLVGISSDSHLFLCSYRIRLRRVRHHPEGNQRYREQQLLGVRVLRLQHESIQHRHVRGGSVCVAVPICVLSSRDACVGHALSSGGCHRHDGHGNQLRLHRLVYRRRLRCHYAVVGGVPRAGWRHRSTGIPPHAVAHLRLEPPQRAGPAVAARLLLAGHRAHHIHHHDQEPGTQGMYEHT